MIYFIINQAKLDHHLTIFKKLWFVNSNLTFILLWVEIKSNSITNNGICSYSIQPSEFILAKGIRRNSTLRRYNARSWKAKGRDLQ